MKSTKKISIPDIRKMKPVDFIELMGFLRKDFGINWSLKIDGSPFNFGMTKGSQFFIESGRSGLLKSDKEILDAIENRTATPKIMTMWFEMRLDKRFMTFLYGLQPGYKFVGELLYVPKAIRDGNKLKFVSMTYDADKLGKLATIIYLDMLIEKDGGLVQVRSPHYFRGRLKKQSNDHINFDDAIINPNIDISDIIEEFFEDSLCTVDIDVLTSRKKDDRMLKKGLTEMILIYQYRVADRILQQIPITLEGYYKFGDTFEGVVAECANGFKFKVQSKEWVHK